MQTSPIDSRVTVESLTDGRDPILARAVLSRRRTILFARRPSGQIAMITALLDDAGSVSRIVGESHFSPEKLDDLDMALAHVRKAVRP